MTALGLSRSRTAATTGAKARSRRRRDEPTPMQQLLLQLVCLGITLTVLFPIIWVLSMSLDPRNISRPYELTLIPPGASLDAYLRVWEKPSANPVSFFVLLKNSFILASGTALFSVGLGVLAAYAFSRLRFRGRQFLMIAVLAVLMLPPVATLAPLFIQLNTINLHELPVLGPVIEQLFGKWNLRNSLTGVGLAITSGLLPFAIWNLKGYLDTIPKELEEAAAVDGATKNQTFRKITLPLALPALAVTAFLGFLGGWTEFYFTSTFLTKTGDYTLAVALNSMVGRYATETPWSDFAAFSIMVALPVSVIYFFFQRYIVGGLALGGVKG
jgi:arabinogalactan oligomer / maltooligosaccharide transport system permease protein